MKNNEKGISLQQNTVKHPDKIRTCFIVFMILFVITVCLVAFVYKFTQSLFDRKRMVGTNYTMSSGATGSARAIEFPFAIRGNKIRSIAISSEVNTDFYIRTKSGTELVIYSNCKRLSAVSPWKWRHFGK